MRSGKTLYAWTPELRAALRAAYAVLRPRTIHSAAIAALQRRTGWPRHALRAEAARLGIAMEHRAWSEADDKGLLALAGTLPAYKIAARIHRTPASVKHRLRKLGISARIREGYSLTDIRQIFGCDERRVTRWVGRGLLGSPVATNMGVRVADSALVHFIRVHHDEFSFRTADETFLKGVLFAHDREGVSIEVVPCPACRGVKARNRSRRAPDGHPAVPIDVGVLGRDAGERAARLDRPGRPAHAAAAPARLYEVGGSGDGERGRLEHAC